MTFPGGTHDLWIRYWLAAGGIDPDKDIETITVPPPQMVANMKVGTMDASASASRGPASSCTRRSATPR
jgi:nitrate/nitrite transport system substrate-binding protein